MDSKKNQSIEKMKFSLTSKDGRNASFEVTNNEIIDLLFRLGFGPEQTSSKGPSISKTPNFNSKTEDIFSEFNLQINTKIERIKILIRSLSTNPGHWFTSKDIVSLYEQHVGESIKLSTVSTNLSRLETQGILQKRGSKKDLEYCLNSQELESLPLYDLIEKRFVPSKKNK